MTGRRLPPPDRSEKWEVDAACLDYDPELFFPQAGNIRGSRRAKAVCETCPVIDQCLNLAVQLGSELEGIWGGTTRYDRYLLRRGEQLVRP